MVSRVKLQINFNITLAEVDDDDDDDDVDVDHYDKSRRSIRDSTERESKRWWQMRIASMMV